VGEISKVLATAKKGEVIVARNDLLKAKRNVMRGEKDLGGRKLVPIGVLNDLITQGTKQGNRTERRTQKKTNCRRWGAAFRAGGGGSKRLKSREGLTRRISPCGSVQSRKGGKGGRSSSYVGEGVSSERSWQKKVQKEEERKRGVSRGRRPISRGVDATNRGGWPS